MAEIKEFPLARHIRANNGFDLQWFGHFAALTLLLFSLAAHADAESPPFAIYEPSPMPVVFEMIRMAKLHPGDVVYDLGCGDGRIVIESVKHKGVRGVCIDIDPQRIKESKENAQRAGVFDRIEFRNEDLFQSDVHNATVVMLFLFVGYHEKLMPKMLKVLRPGTRIVSHFYGIEGWKPDITRHVRLSKTDNRQIFAWTLPKGGVNLPPPKPAPTKANPPN